MPNQLLSFLRVPQYAFFDYFQEKNKRIIFCSLAPFLTLLESIVLAYFSQLSLCRPPPTLSSSSQQKNSVCQELEYCHKYSPGHHQYLPQLHHYHKYYSFHLQHFPCLYPPQYFHYLLPILPKRFLNLDTRPSSLVVRCSPV